MLALTNLPGAWLCLAPCRAVLTSVACDYPSLAHRHELMNPPYAWRVETTWRVCVCVICVW